MQNLPAILLESSPVSLNPVTSTDLLAILPVLILLGTGAVVLVMDLFQSVPAGEGETRKPVLHFLSILGAVIAGAQICGALAAPDTGATSFFRDALRIDKFSLAMSLLIVLGAAFSLLGAADTLRRRGLEHGEFHALILFSAASMILFTQSASLIMAFLSLETLSMSVYVLTAYTREEKRSNEGALKYFILGSLSTGFLLLGLVFIYGATRSTNLVEIEAALRGGGANLDSPLLLCGLALTLIGLSFKIGAFPFHSWLPDAYEGALSIVTGFMAVTVKVASFAVLLRLALLFGSTPSAGPIGAELHASLTAALSTLAVLTMVFGNVVALVQRSLKRMLAYSAIAHTGYLLVGVITAMEAKRSGLAAGTGAGQAVLFYLFPYALMTLGAFTCMSYLGRGTEDCESLESYRGLGRQQPVLALGILLLMISFAGIPPTAGFWGKLLIFRQAIDTGHWGLALTGIVTSVVSVYYYLSVVVNMYMQPGGENEPLSTEPRTCGKLAILLTVGAVAIVGLLPDTFFRLSMAYSLR